jgi:hypothetical protein
MGNRPFWVRTGSVFVRAAHLVAACAIGGACLLGDGDLGPHGWWAVATVSGVLLLAAEAVAHPEMYREPAGWAVVLKLILIGAIAAVPSAGAWLMAAAIAIAALGAHFPRNWRHRRLF